VEHDSLGVALESVLVVLASHGNDAAFTELVRRRQRAIRGLLARLSGDASLADDLAQEAFLQAWKKLALLRTPEAFGGWLRQIAIHVWLQHARAKRPFTDPIDDVNPNDCRSPSDEQALTRRVDLESALATLSPPQRLCIVLSYQEGMSHSEIAQVTRLQLGTVKSHISRATTRMREWFEPCRRRGSR
jgi:RNA polymerase sigma-70 factor, ECF subfamily